MTEAAVAESRVTKEAMIDRAISLGYGERFALGRRFARYRSEGLIGKPLGKVQERGGSSLWHSVQGDLWIRLLERQRAGVGFRELTNIPVYLWHRGVEGIDVKQAQRALRSFVIRTHNAPPDRGTRGDSRASARSRYIRGAVDSLASPETSRRDRRALYDVFHTISVPSFSESYTFVAADRFAERYHARAVIQEKHLHAWIFAVTGDHSTAEQRTTVIIHQLRALENLDLILAENGEAWRSWEWVRWNYPLAGLPTMPACPLILSLFGMIDFPDRPMSAAGNP